MIPRIAQAAAAAAAAAPVDGGRVARRASAEGFSSVAFVAEGRALQEQQAAITFEGDNDNDNGAFAEAQAAVAKEDDKKGGAAGAPAAGGGDKKGGGAAAAQPPGDKGDKGNKGPEDQQQPPDAGKDNVFDNEEEEEEEEEEANDEEEDDDDDDDDEEEEEEEEEGEDAPAMSASPTSPATVPPALPATQVPTPAPTTSPPQLDADADASSALRLRLQLSVFSVGDWTTEPESESEPSESSLSASAEGADELLRSLDVQGPVLNAVLRVLCGPDGGVGGIGAVGVGSRQPEILIMSSFNETVCLHPGSVPSSSDALGGLSVVSASDPLVISVDRGIKRTDGSYYGGDNNDQDSQEQQVRLPPLVEWDVYTVVYRVLRVGDYFRREALDYLGGGGGNGGGGDDDDLLLKEAARIMREGLQAVLNDGIVDGRFDVGLREELRDVIVDLEEEEGGDGDESSSLAKIAAAADVDAAVDSMYGSIVGREEETFAQALLEVQSKSGGGGDGRVPTYIAYTSTFSAGAAMRYAGAALLVLTLAAYFALLVLSKRRRKRKVQQRQEQRRQSSTEDSVPASISAVQRDVESGRDGGGEGGDASTNSTGERRPAPAAVLTGGYKDSKELANAVAEALHDKPSKDDTASPSSGGATSLSDCGDEEQQKQRGSPSSQQHANSHRLSNPSANHASLSPHSNRSLGSHSGRQASVPISSRNLGSGIYLGPGCPVDPALSPLSSRGSPGSHSHRSSSSRPGSPNSGLLLPGFPDVDPASMSPRSDSTSKGKGSGGGSNRRFRPRPQSAKDRPRRDDAEKDEDNDDAFVAC